MTVLIFKLYLTLMPNEVLKSLQIVPIVVLFLEHLGFRVDAHTEPKGKRNI